MSIPRDRIYLIAVSIYSLATFGLSLVAKVPPMLPDKYHFDKVLHAVEYGILAYLCIKYAETALRSHGRTLLMGAILFSTGIGGLNEIIQMFVPLRSASWGDAVANLVGAGLAGGGYWILNRPAKRFPIVK